ncbi:single-stranded DNA-binding protein [Bacillus paralicheniformis]|uniref:single-stranded DNA-binding protein n=1 Tax=Bacillus TaxID=1386 RepID=UPI0013EE8EEE|nr:MULTISPECIES: single-stranded DNA-binding protein [Bacillus]QII26962.1 single-stranded DNA-binding protein [Bacillus altitudinis]QII51430.1 single-stranded DNA-binding protein [Bacillus paralicheniformis]
MSEKVGYNPTFQKVMFCGRFAKNPELQFLSNGTAVCNFGLVINRGYENKSDYIPCVAWENKAKIIADYCKQGTLILVEGKFKSSTFKDSEERDHFELVFEVDKKGVLNFMGQKKDDNGLSSESTEE